MDDRIGAEIARIKAQLEKGAFPARHPGRHRAMLACRCGTVLDAADMVRIQVPNETFDHDTSTAIYRIGCRGCADEVAGEQRQPQHRRPRPIPRTWLA